MNAKLNAATLKGTLSVSGYKSGEVTAEEIESALGYAPAATPDWEQNDPTASDYIKNRPFYTETNTQRVTLVEEQSIFSASNGYTINKIFKPVFEGTEPCIITFEGVEYTAGEQTFNDANLSYIFSVSDSIYLEHMVIDDLYLFYHPDLVAKNQYSIKIERVQKKETIHKMSHKYVESELPVFAKAGQVLTTAISGDDKSVKWADSAIPTVTASDVGKFLRVSADGTWAAETIANAEEASF